jgi:hypothetical protein
MSTPPTADSPADSAAERTRTPPPIMSLSSDEFAQMILHSDMTEQLSATFTDDPVVTIALRYYCFLSETIERLERDLLRQRIEQQDLFGHLIRKRRFQQRIAPLVVAYRRPSREERYRYHPYSHTPSPILTPSDADAYNNEVLPSTRATSPPPSPKNRSSGSSSQEEVGTKRNPITIEDDEPLNTEWQPTMEEIRIELRKKRDE